MRALALLLLLALMAPGAEADEATRTLGHAGQATGQLVLSTAQTGETLAGWAGGQAVQWGLWAFALPWQGWGSLLGQARPLLPA